VKPCAKPIDYETLVAWWLDELQDERTEEHLMGCAHCSSRLEQLAAFAQGIRAAVKNGALGLALTPKFLEHLKNEGLRIREYPANPGDTIQCTIRAEDDAVVSRLKAPLAGVTRLDVLQATEIAGRIERARIEDVPFNEEAGEVLLQPSAAALRKMPAHIWRAQLLAVDDKGERSLAEYTFAHTPA
jgi:hypothetical protein